MGLRAMNAKTARLLRKWTHRFRKGASDRDAYRNWNRLSQLDRAIMRRQMKEELGC